MFDFVLERNIKKLIFLFLCFNYLSITAQTKENKPNIIIILADDLGWGDLGFHNSDILTPNIDKLAKEGLVLNHFYTSPICSPTRAGIMTGRYPDRFGLRQTVIPPWSEFGVDTSEIFLPQFLKTAGYKTRIALGKWHLGHASKKYLPLSRGFTHFYGHYNGAIDYFTHEREGELDWHNDWETSLDKGYATDLVAQEAINCIDNTDSKSPFFMYIAFNAPHTPLQAKKEDLKLYDFDENMPIIPQSKGYSSYGRGNTKRQTYAAMVTNMDRNIGKILDKLKALQIEDNTIVLFLSDNGANNHGGGSSGKLRGHKFQEWEGGVRSSAIIRWPAKLDHGEVNNQTMGYVDILPTLMAAAQVDNKAIKHKPFDGINMLPSILNPQHTISRNLYLGYGSIVNNNWKFVKSNSGNQQMKEKSNQLFRIKNDPYENSNLIDKYPSIAQKLKDSVTKYDAIKPQKEVPPYGQGRENFHAPDKWKILME